MFLQKYPIFVVLLVSFMLSGYTEASDPLKEILDSASKPSELPFIEKNLCCSSCPSKPTLSKKEGCDLDSTLMDIKKNAKQDSDKNLLMLVQSKNYAIVMREHARKMYIVSIPDRKKIFAMLPGRKIFKSLYATKQMKPKKRFVIKYRKLKSIYSEIQFRELCRYLTAKKHLYSIYSKSKWQ